MHDDHDIGQARELKYSTCSTSLHHIVSLSSPSRLKMLFHMLIRCFVFSVLAEFVISFIVPDQEVLTSLPTNKDPNAILAA